MARARGEAGSQEAHTQCQERPPTAGLGRVLLMRALFLGLAALSLLAGCGDDDGSTCSTSADCSGGRICVDSMCADRPDGGGLDLGEDPPDGSVVDAGPCDEECGDDVCIAGRCCPRGRACGSVCCPDTDVCSFGSCVTIGDTCTVTEDCPNGSYCEPALGEDTVSCGEVTGRTGRCLPEPPTCPEGTEPDPANPSCVSECSFTPPSGDLDVTLLYQWGAFDGDRLPPNVDDVRNSPIVAQLDDDDCDGNITGRDVPEIIVIASPDDSNRPDGTNPVGNLVALSVEGDALVERYRIDGTVNPWTYPAAGEIDGEPGVEVVACSVDRQTAIAYGLDAASPGAFVEVWESPPLGVNCQMPSLADLDQDGDVEVVLRGAILDGATGAIEYTYDTTPGGSVIAVDVDDDPDHRLEVIGSRRIYQLGAGSELTTIADSGIGGNYSLVAQLDGTGRPEIVSIASGNHTLTLWRYDESEASGARILRSGIDINGDLDPTRCVEGSAGRTRGGGPPTAGDVNADGVPDIAVAGGVGYAVLDGARLMDASVTDPLELFFWSQDTVDCSSARTGSSVFDFNGDGRAEVLYADEQTFRIYEGATGTVLFDTCSTNGTILEQPVVADVDGDGQANVVVVSNARYRECLEGPETAISGVRVYGSAEGDWVRTRRVWNQHAYHITNVNEDATIPRQETPNWDDPDLNNFRLNRQPGNALAAADAVLALTPLCSESAITATVRNLGESVIPAGATVRVYRGIPSATPDAADQLAEVVTSRALYPAQAEALTVPLTADDAQAILFEGSETAWGRVSVPEGLQECRTGNQDASLAETCMLL